MNNLELRKEPGKLVFKDFYTPWAYCLYHDDGGIEYVFVAPRLRRRGLGRLMLQIVQRITSSLIYPATPMSEKGEAFFQHLDLIKTQHPGRLRDHMHKAYLSPPGGLACPQEMKNG